MLIVGIIFCLIWLLYIWWVYNYNYWKKKGVAEVKATFPWGSLPAITLLNKFQGTAFQDAYNQLAPHPYGGIIVLRRPHLILRDPQVIKHIMIKDFSYFTDRTTADNINEPVSFHLFNLGGERWRHKRVHLGPTFSAGKMKTIFLFYKRIQEDLFNRLDRYVNPSKDFDAKELYSRFTIDFIGSWAFGIVMKALKEDDNIFFKLGPTMFPPHLNTEIKLKLTSFNLCFGFENKYKFIPPELGKLVNEVTKESLKLRKENGGKGNDFIDLLLKLQEKKTLITDRVVKEDGTLYQSKMDVTFDDLAAEVLIFFAAGFDTASSMIAYTLYELAHNHVMQEKLIREIDDLTEKHQGLTYDALQEMEYLNKVVSETGRKYPVVPVLTRTCVRDYKMPGDGDVTIEAGTRVIIPLHALHNDPLYYPDPEKFDPERFNPENAAKIPSCIYMPFGEGPRYCIGKRIGLIQVKMGVALTLLKYRVFTSPRTPKTLNFQPTMLVTTLDHPIWVQVQHRNKNTHCTKIL